MSRCIFCTTYHASSQGREHVIPESLGGVEVLRRAFVCDKCNGYFGAKVEQRALGSPLFASIRSLLCIPTKTSRFAQYEFDRGLLVGTPEGPIVSISEDDAEKLLHEKTGIIIPFEFSFKGSIARTLLKSALELLAETGAVDIFDDQFDPARMAARAPLPGATWPLAYSLGAVQEEETVFVDALNNTGYKYELRQHPIEGTIVFQIRFYVTERIMCFLMVPITKEGDFSGQIVQFNVMNPSVVPLVLEHVRLCD